MWINAFDLRVNCALLRILPRINSLFFSTHKNDRNVRTAFFNRYVFLLFRKFRAFCLFTSLKPFINSNNKWWNSFWYLFLFLEMIHMQIFLYINAVKNSFERVFSSFFITKLATLFWTNSKIIVSNHTLTNTSSLNYL